MRGIGSSYAVTGALNCARAPIGAIALWLSKLAFRWNCKLPLAFSGVGNLNGDPGHGISAPGMPLPSPTGGAQPWSLAVPMDFPWRPPRSNGPATGSSLMWFEGIPQHSLRSWPFLARPLFDLKRTPEVVAYRLAPNSCRPVLSPNRVHLARVMDGRVVSPVSNVVPFCTSAAVARSFSLEHQQLSATL